MTRPRLRDTTWIAIPVFVLIAAGSIALGWFSASEKDHAACDNAVHELLTTHDRVELRRSIFLIRQLDCSVRRRL